MKKTLISILALILFISLAQSSFARQSAKLIVNNNTGATLQVWSRYYEGSFQDKTSSNVYIIPPGKRMAIDGILPIGLVTVYIGAQYADPSVEKITRSFQVNNPGTGIQPKPRELTITPADFYTDELIDYHSRDDVSEDDPTENEDIPVALSEKIPKDESKPWEVWVHDTSTTCCNSNCDGGSEVVAVASKPTTVFAYHGTRSEKKLKGAEVIKGFKTEAEMNEWVCKQKRTEMKRYVSNIAILKGKCVSNVPCPPPE